MRLSKVKKEFMKSMARILRREAIGGTLTQDLAYRILKVSYFTLEKMENESRKKKSGLLS